MEAYTYKCPGCGSSLEYDLKTKLMVCNSCCEMYSLDALGIPEIPDAAVTSVVDESLDSEYMDINVYHCNSCGSEIMTTDVEISNFCSYCGQPTIFFDRVSREKKPAKIIPFFLTKEQALEKAKAKFAKGKYMLDTMQNVSVESVYGIYMPYWAYEAEMGMHVNVSIRSDNKIHEYERNEKLQHTVLLDASARLSDYTSKMLNPFSSIDAVDFNPAYLSGFYADRSDVDSNDRTNDVSDYMEEILTEKIYNTVPGAPSREMRTRYKDLYNRVGGFGFDVLSRQFDISSHQYILCPVYFITFKVAEKTVVILVNGSNGKIVGSIPADENKIKAVRKRDSIIYAIVMGVIGAMLFRYMPILWSAMLLLVLGGSVVLAGAQSKKRYEEMYWKTNTQAMFDLSNNRK